MNAFSLDGVRVERRALPRRDFCVELPLPPEILFASLPGRGAVCHARLCRLAGSGGLAPGGGRAAAFHAARVDRHHHSKRHRHGYLCPARAGSAAARPG